MIKSIQKENGFTLIEATLVTVVMISVFALFGSLLLKIYQTSEKLEERSFQNNQGISATDTMRDDFEMAGNGLTFSNAESFSGEIRPRFFTNAGYEVYDNGDIYSNGNSVSSYLRSSMSWRGNGNVSAIPTFVNSNRGVSIFGLKIEDTSNSANYREILLSKLSITIIENGVQVFTMSTPTGSSRFKISVQRVVNNNTETCRVIYSQQMLNNSETALFESQNLCLSDSITPSLLIPRGRTLSSDTYSMGGSVVKSDDSSSPVKISLLPEFRSTRLIQPIAPISNNEFVILSADKKTPVFYLASDVFVDSSSSTNISVRFSEASSVNIFEKGETLFISDYWSKKSCLLEILEFNIIDSSFVVRPILAQSSDITSNFQGFGSNIVDFDNFQFKSGTRIVKLNSPVFYRFEKNDNDSHSLFRREGNAVWTTIVPFMSNFIFESKSESENASFNISYDIIPEAFQNTNAENLEIRLSFAPRALNRTTAAY